MKTLGSALAVLVLATMCAPLHAQEAAQPVASTTTVPRLVNFAGKAVDAQGRPIAGVAGVTFAIYKDQTEGSPLWLETQNVQADAKGNYTVQLGASKPNGLPLDLFSSGEARWLGVRVNGGEEQTRILLLSVPYALKAADAETIGGLPPSAFVLAAPLVANPASSSSAPVTSAAAPPAASGVTTSGGTATTIPLFSTATDIENSAMTQTGSGTTAKIGIGTTTPTSTLDVKGAGTIRGILTSPATGAATAAAGKVSQGHNFVASSFSSTTSTAVNQTFQWLAEPAANDTTSPSGTLNLLYGLGATKPAETGVKIAPNGLITFASGQTFPGTGAGTITGVTAGTDLTGGGTSGAVTLNLDTTQVPQLNAANTFTGNQTVNGNLSATSLVSGSAYLIGSNLFGFGSAASDNAYLGFAGNLSSTGASNTAVGTNALATAGSGSTNTAMGESSLALNTTGSSNTAYGASSVASNTSGTSNTGVGYRALAENTTGSGNVGLGYGALSANSTGFDNVAVGADAAESNDGSGITGNNNTMLGTGTALSTGTLSNATGVGALAEVTESNALVLGSINGVNGASASTKVGIGVTAPTFTLDIHGGPLHVAGSVAQTHSAQGAYLDWNAITGSMGETDLINNEGGGVGGFAFMNTPSTGTPLSTLMFITGAGRVGIGTTAPDSTLSVNGTADKTGGGSWGTFSDGRLKTLHGDFTSGLSQIMQLQPVRYRYKEQNAMNIRDHDEHVGFVAQDVQSVIPEAVTTNASGYLMVNNDPILWTMLNAIKEQQKEFQQQQTVLRAQAAAIRELKTQLRVARQTLRKVNAQLMVAQPTLRAAK